MKQIELPIIHVEEDPDVLEWYDSLPIIEIEDDYLSKASGDSYVLFENSVVTKIIHPKSSYHVGLKKAYIVTLRTILSYERRVNEINYIWGKLNESLPEIIPKTKSNVAIVNGQIRIVISQAFVKGKNYTNFEDVTTEMIDVSNIVKNVILNLRFTDKRFDEIYRMFDEFAYKKRKDFPDLNFASNFIGVNNSRFVIIDF